MSVDVWPPRNPFATRYVRPGAVEYVFPARQHAGQLMNRLERARWRGQLTGPHGAGKTTLLHTLEPLLQKANRHVCWCTLHAGQRHLSPAVLQSLKERDPRGLLIVDGYEQLGVMARARLNRICRQAGRGLLVTSHSDAGFPQIYHVQPALPLVAGLVARLLDADSATVDQRWLSDQFDACQGNVRELLFALYDWYESQRIVR